MIKTKPKPKKDFWNMSWNPVWGCNNKCLYCYARGIAKRFPWEIAEKEIKYLTQKKILIILNEDDYWLTIECLKENLRQFKPTWLESNYVRKFPKKPSIIFVNSMSDPGYWKQEWYEKILKRITENMQHTFVILTKDIDIYKKYIFPHNTILGITAINYAAVGFALQVFKDLDLQNKTLLSIEPIQENIKTDMHNFKKYIDWIHVGAESGNRKEKPKATPEMIKPFYDLPLPIFMKENIRGICSPNLRKEFPI